MPIPRLIHQMWIGDQSKRPSTLMQTWRDMNPSCEYIMWTEENLHGVKFFNQKQIDDMPELNGKCDIMRYELLYRYGGLFMDADTKCVKTLDDFFFEQDRFSCWENEEVGLDPETKISLVASGHQGCAQADPFYFACILELSRIDMTTGRAWQVCGNRFLSTMIERLQHKYPMTIYPSHYFIPKHGTGVEYKGDGAVYSEHYWGTTHDLYGKL